RISPILSAEICGETVPLTDFYVITLTERKKISPFLKKIPLIPTDFDHLKRVDKMGRILLQPDTAPLSEALLEIMGQFGITEDDLLVVKVPARKPATRRQFDWAKNYWSTSFHPDKDGEELTSGSYTDHLLGHPVMNMVRNLAKCQRREDDYLATGCDVYLRDEPCAMCAMALVHCRAAHVFFCRTTTNGVLAPGKWQLQFEPAINHHYLVFHVKSENEDKGNAVCGK
ncbi:hypothetical protein Angca_003184, partial [Angiostrongylus cantonensis]